MVSGNAVIVVANYLFSQLNKTAGVYFTTTILAALLCLSEPAEWTQIASDVQIDTKILPDSNTTQIYRLLPQNLNH